MDASSDGGNPLPPAVPQAVQNQLEPGETVLGSFEPDLNAQLNYAAGQAVVLTDRRLLSVGGAGFPADDGSSGTADCSFWQLSSSLSLRTKSQGGLATLELLDPESLLAQWRFTNAVSLAAHRLVHQFEVYQREGQIGAVLERREKAVCPSCGEVLAPGQPVCPTCTPAPGVHPSESLLRLAKFARPRAPMLVLGLVLTLVSTAAGLIPPYLTMPIVDRVLVPVQAGQPANLPLLTWCLLGLVGAALLAWGFGWARNYVLAWASERISSDLRNRTYAHLHTLSVEYFGGKRTGDLMSRISSDTDRICNFLSISALDFIVDIMMIVLTAVILFTINPLLALVTLVPFPAMAWLTHAARGRMRRGYRQGGRAWAEMTSVLADTIPGIRVVKAFAQEKREVQRFQRSNEHILAANDRVNRIWAFFGPMVSLLSDAGIIIVWVVGSCLVIKSTITLGVMNAFVLYIYRFYGKLESLSWMVRSMQRAGASAQRIFEILDRVPSVPEPVRAVHPGRLQAAIELRDVGFRYTTRPVLQNVNLSIAPGEMIGLVGHSGAGKSTLVNLICRFYDVQEGSIRADGADIRSFPVEEYRRNIGMVLQEPFLFYGTIAENIAYGKPDATRAEIIRAARAARCHDFILDLADGYDSMVGERGQSLSGGERQRISIARALLIDPRILILDEATSSVDTETEREIQEALENLIRGRTTIAIAHRLSTLRRADRLVVLERGRIAEIGPHQELLQTPGVYSRLHQAQQDLAQSLGI